MKTLQEIKSHYAQEQGYEDWRELQGFHSRNPREIESYMNEICIRAQKLALEKAVENAKIEMDLQTDWYFINKESITNEQNLIR